MVFPFFCKILKTANYIDSFDFTDMFAERKCEKMGGYEQEGTPFVRIFKVNLRLVSDYEKEASSTRQMFKYSLVNNLFHR